MRNTESAESKSPRKILRRTRLPSNKVSTSQLSPEEKEVFRLFVSLMNNMFESINKVYFFCEHYYEEDLVNIALKRIEEHLDDFNNLSIQVKSQINVKKQLEMNLIPSYVSFSIPKWRSDFDDWPLTPNSNNWVKLCVKHFNILPPIITENVPQGKSWEERISKVEAQKRKIENQKNREIRKKTNKIRKVNERLQQQKEEAKIAFNEKYDCVLSRREAILNQIVEKAKNEIEKIEENNYLQNLKYRGKKLLYEKNMSLAAERHQDHVKKRIEKAKERIQPKIKNNIDDFLLPKQNKKDIAFIDAINQRFLPQMMFKINTEEIPIISLPSFNEENPIKNHYIEKISNALINDSQDDKLIISYLKQVNEQKTFIKFDSFESKIINERLQFGFILNFSNENQIIHCITNLLPNSFPFAINIGFSLISSFLSICNKRDSLSIIKEILHLWAKILLCNFDQSQVLFLSQIINSSILRYLCYLVENLLPSDLANELAKDLISTIISFFSSIITFIRCNKIKIEPSIIELFNSSTYIYNCLFHYLFVSKIKPEKTAVLLSMFIIEFHDNLEDIITEEISTNIIDVVKNYINKKPMLHEFILFIGIISRYSQKIRDKCRIAEPSILSSLSNLPLIYFLRSTESNILIPTLISICYSSPENIKYLCQKVSITMLINYLKTNPPKSDDIFSPHLRIPNIELTEIINQLERSAA